MTRALLILFSCLANYETLRELVHGAFITGLANMSALGCIGAIFALRRGRLTRDNGFREVT